ncbi:LytTR family DNA-binding domain-containing protein [Roseibium sp. MMSF_3544]|uniref:LytTR family DNA-binding domain-containing protein n=1 Tax=unclassified Roseibium TaxID=2629323 RepID=UPI00273F2DC6|nr:LytTR family DNA-binding domain-containing protein [Roseibium sp. MMSF_3544]
MIRTYAAQISFLALAAALLLASTQTQRPDHWSLAGLYGYWTVRVLIEAGLFVAFAELIGRLPGLKPHVLTTAALAAIVSLVPFALSITAMDLILGLPELDGSVSFDNAQAGAAVAQSSTDSRIGSFFREIVYLSDNHLALCLLLTAPKLFQALANTGATAGSLSDAAQDPEETSDENGAMEPEAEKAQSAGAGYLRHLDQPLKGILLRVEAQEHYVRLVTDQENRMILYRFNDVVAELPDTVGMQVHRSHWIAFAAVENLARDGGRLWIVVRDGSKVPVSRKYTAPVQARFGKLEADAKRAVN